MKIVQVSTFSNSGGAGRAAYRLHQSLRGQSIESTIVSLRSDINEANIITPRGIHKKIGPFVRNVIDRAPLSIYPNKSKELWSVSWLPYFGINTVINLLPNIIHLHWISAGFLSISDIKKLSKYPNEWTLHDMNAFTGGCNYSNGCNRFVHQCGVCPQLGSKNKYDLSALGWMRKKRNWKKIQFDIITPSHWLKKQAESSSLFSDANVHVIPNCIDIDKFKPIKKDIAKNILNLNPKKKYILFGSGSLIDDRRKGFDLLIQALLGIADNNQHLELMVFGNYFNSSVVQNKFNVVQFGPLTDDLSLALVYSAADVFVAPSREDNLPNTIMESMSCGTPVVGFNIGGIPDMINHKNNGYVAIPEDTIDLGKGILWVLDDKNKDLSLASEARKTVENNYSYEVIASKHIALYNSISHKHSI